MSYEQDIEDGRNEWEGARIIEAQTRCDDENDELGKRVRQAWIAYCLETGDTKPSHIAPWEELSEWDKEADRRIGKAIARYILGELY